MATAVAEGIVVLKFPSPSSFRKVIRNPNHLPTRPSSTPPPLFALRNRRRRFSLVVSAASTSSSSSLISEDNPKLGPLSLGHSTRPHFPILHQVCGALNQPHLLNFITLVVVVFNFFNCYNPILKTTLFFCCCGNI